MKTHSSPASHHRHGFTLLELLIVIVVISVLIGLLFPVISGIFTNVDNTQVQVEFTKIDGAIANFRTDFGNKLPYSSVTLSETAAGWTTVDRNRIRQIWDNFTFEDTDFDGNGSIAGSHTLTSSEALVFFLGGMEATVGSKNLVGFSKNGINPFSRTGENRIGPFYPFDASRLVDNDADGFYEYAGFSSSDGGDTIVYAANNNGQGYSSSAGAVNHYYKADGNTPWNKDSYQLIDPGPDGDLGFDAEPSPFVVNTWYEGVTTLDDAEKDNLTNFTTSPLGE